MLLPGGTSRHHGKVSGESTKEARVVEERTVLVIQDGSCTAIRKRPPKGLLAGLYELPNLLGHLTREEVLDKVKNMQLEPLYIERLPDAKHIFSHIEWRMTGYLIRVQRWTQTEDCHLFLLRKNSLKSSTRFRLHSEFM